MLAHTAHIQETRDSFQRRTPRCLQEAHKPEKHINLQAEPTLPCEDETLTTEAILFPSTALARPSCDRLSGTRRKTQPTNGPSLNLCTYW